MSVEIAGTTMGLSYDEITEILKIIDSSSCDEVVIETGDIKLVVRRRAAGSVRLAVLPDTAAAAEQAAHPATEAPKLQPSSAPTVAEGHVALRAPMVGTFYRAPAPDAPPFVEIGSSVEKGDPVCIIEVMKLFTTIHAECSGKVVEIGAENAMLVEFGQTLFVIDPH
jgi:acetyl-CoA carboxylase biotin carboxyl carrier protein